MPPGAFASLLVLFLCRYRFPTKLHLKVDNIVLPSHTDPGRVVFPLLEDRLAEAGGIFVRSLCSAEMSFVQTQMGSPFSGVERTAFVCRSAVAL